MENNDPENEAPEQQEERSRPARLNPLAAIFLPREGYFITPIIILINVAVFLLMIITGINPLFPNPEQMMGWGVNIRSLTMNGEPWRLLTACFLHYGILHIAANMYSLSQVGRILEPFIGRWRFAVIYLCSGIGGSVASMWWNESAAAAGASGAIVGIIGTLGALAAMPNLIRKEVRKDLLKSVGQSLLMLVLVGMSKYIDNAGHFGGLAIGALCGFIIYFEVKAFYYEQKNQYRYLALCVLATAGLCTAFWMMTPKPFYKDFDSYISQLMSRFSEEDEKAQLSIRKNAFAPMSEADIRKNILNRYYTCAQIVDTLGSFKNINDYGVRLTGLLRSYTEARINQSDFILKAVQDTTSATQDSIRFYDEAAGKANLLIEMLNHKQEAEESEGK